MKIKGLEIVNEDYEDLRFGNIDVYYDLITEDLIMVKEKTSKNEKEF